MREHEHTAESDALLHDEDGPYLPGHHDVSYDLTTPREFTARGGWNIACECGVAVGETGDEDFQERWIAHLNSVLLIAVPEGAAIDCVAGGCRWGTPGEGKCECVTPPGEQR